MYFAQHPGLRLHLATPTWPTTGRISNPSMTTTTQQAVRNDLNNFGSCTAPTSCAINGITYSNGTLRTATLEPCIRPVAT